MRFGDETNSLAYGEWSHIVFTYDASSAAIIYNNGVQVARDTPSSQAGKNSAKLYIGKREDDQGGFNGMLDELIMFDRTLTKEEVAQIYEAQK